MAIRHHQAALSKSITIETLTIVLNLSVESDTSAGTSFFSAVIPFASVGCVLVCYPPFTIHL